MAAERRRALNAKGAAFTDFPKSSRHTPPAEARKCYRADIIPEMALQFTLLTAALVLFRWY